MSRLSIEALEKAVATIEKAVMEYEQHPDLLSCRDGAIQRFEITMDLSWKLLQRVLMERFSVQIGLLRSKKDLFREAATYELIADTERWLQHYESRNDTSHVYDEDVAARVFEHIKEFLPDVRDLVIRLKNVA
ncbi:MAG: nucleotidyltransferase substrate binding protein [Magnetococcales bacterium]|nr:nucleotidyltransferase substrate binding protein [Magnetococcales bacterium]